MNRGISRPIRGETEDMASEKLTRIKLSLGKVLIIIPQILLPIRILIKTDKFSKSLIISKDMFRIKGLAFIECSVKREELNAV